MEAFAEHAQRLEAYRNVQRNKMKGMVSFDLIIGESLNFLFRDKKQLREVDPRSCTLILNLLFYENSGSIRPYDPSLRL